MIGSSWTWTTSTASLRSIKSSLNSSSDYSAGSLNPILYTSITGFYYNCLMDAYSIVENILFLYFLFCNKLNMIVWLSVCTLLLYRQNSLRLSNSLALSKKSSLSFTKSNTNLTILTTRSLSKTIALLFLIIYLKKSMALKFVLRCFWQSRMYGARMRLFRGLSKTSKVRN